MRASVSGLARGVKGAGEAGVGGSAAAVANAINDALRPLGVALNQLPFSPSRVWGVIQAGTAAKQNIGEAA